MTRRQRAGGVVDLDSRLDPPPRWLDLRFEGRTPGSGELKPGGWIAVRLKGQPRGPATLQL